MSPSPPVFRRRLSEGAEIYLAGPDLFYPDADLRYARLARLLEEEGLRPLDPRAGCPRAAAGDREGARAIRRHCLALLARASGVLANLTGFRGPETDPGTAYEVGYAAALGIPVVGYTLDALRPLRARVDDGEPTAVEDFGWPANLMLCAGHPLAASPEEAVRALRRELESGAPPASARARTTPF